LQRAAVVNHVPNLPNISPIAVARRGPTQT
jgi:hypothetical protein